MVSLTPKLFFTQFGLCKISLCFEMKQANGVVMFWPFSEMSLAFMFFSEQYPFFF